LGLSGTSASGTLAGVDEAGLAVADLAVPRLVDQHRRPQLEVEAGGDEEVGLFEHQGERGLRLDEVGVLVAARDRQGIDLCAADRLGDGGIGGEGGDHLDGSGEGR
jgi:hypothetical protein